MKNITNEQIAKLSEILDREVKVNADWAIACLGSWVEPGRGNESTTPFTSDDVEKYSDYVHDAVEEDHDPIEFLQCWIVSERMGHLLEKVGELVIDTKWTGCFWFRKTYGQGIEFDSEVQDAFAALL